MDSATKALWLVAQGQGLQRRVAKPLALVAEVQAAQARADTLRRKHEKTFAKVEQFLSEAQRKGHTGVLAKLTAETRRIHLMVEAARREREKQHAELKLALAACRGRRVRSGVRPRASRGRAVRLRGSRRTTTATRAGPRSSDPALGDEPPGDRSPSREGAVA
jgi:hypothetical protein